MVEPGTVGRRRAIERLQGDVPVGVRVGAQQRHAEPVVRHRLADATARRGPDAAQLADRFLPGPEAHQRTGAVELDHPRLHVGLPGRRLDVQPAQVKRVEGVRVGPRQEHRARSQDDAGAAVAGRPRDLERQ